MKHYFFLLSLLIFIGCNKGETPDDETLQQQGGEITVHISAEPDMLHPCNGQSNNRSIILDLVHQQLIRVNIQQPQELIPLLAKELPVMNEDRSVQNFELHPDAKWTDGRPIVAKDVEFSLKAYLCPLTNNPGRQTHLRNLKSFEVNDEQNFTISLQSASVLNRYYATNFFIINPKLYDPEGTLENYTVEQMLNDTTIKQDEALIAWAEAFNSNQFAREAENIRGSGLYVAEAWEADSYISLKRNENYWGKELDEYPHQQRPDRVIFKIIPNDPTIDLVFQDEQLDVGLNINTEAFKAMKKNENVTENYALESIERDSYAYLGLNTRADGTTHKKLFTDKRVRNAIAHALPIDQIIEDVLEGEAKRLASPVSPSSPDYNKTLKPIPFNLDESRRLLKEAGWNDADEDGVLEKEIDGTLTPFRFKLNYVKYNDIIQNVMLMIQNELKKVGIEAELDPIDQKTLSQRMPSHDFDAFISALGSSSTPYPFHQVWHTNQWVQNGYNFAGFGNATSDSLIEAAQNAPNMDKRKPIVDQIQQLIHEEQASIFLWNFNSKMIAHKRLDNVKFYRERPNIIINTLGVQE